MPQDRPLLTAQQVAVELNISADTIRRWTRDGLLRAVELPSGGKRYRPADIDQLLGRAS